MIDDQLPRMKGQISKSRACSFALTSQLSASLSPLLSPPSPDSPPFPPQVPPVAPQTTQATVAQPPPLFACLQLSPDRQTTNRADAPSLVSLLHGLVHFTFFSVLTVTVSQTAFHLKYTCQQGRLDGPRQGRAAAFGLPSRHGCEISIRTRCLRAFSLRGAFSPSKSV